MLTLRAVPVAILQILLLLALGLLLRWGTSGWVAAIVSVAVVDAAAVGIEHWEYSHVRGGGRDEP